MPISSPRQCPKGWQLKIQNFYTLPSSQGTQEEEDHFVDKKLLTCLKIMPFHNTGLKGKNIKLAIIDTGYDKDHPAFQTMNITSKNFTDVSDDVSDTDGHGTHVLSIATAIAPLASFLVAKVLKGNENVLEQTIIQGLDWAVQNGAHVINLSLCSNEPVHESYLDIHIKKLIKDHRVAVVVAVGNSGDPLKPSVVGSPGIIDRVITVGACDYEGIVGDFSQHWRSHNKPELVAPGVGILGAKAKSKKGVRMTGTSMATPAVTGMCALMIEKMKQVHCPDLGCDKLKSFLTAAATHRGSSIPHAQGHGLCTLSKAISHIMLSVQE